MEKKSAKYFESYSHYALLKALKNSLCRHGDMPTDVIFTMKLSIYNNIYMHSTEHVDADKSTTQVFKNTFTLVAANTVSQCNRIAF